jgi:hypothetical protein
MRFMMMLFAALAIAVPAAAQRGMGEKEGMARKPDKPQPVTLSGEVVSVTTERCEYTTGRAEIGTHFVLQTDEGKERNIHLGPAKLVKKFADQLTPGEEVRVRAFRTENLPEGQYIAQWVQVGDSRLRLRNENLRPVWAPRVGGQDDQGPMTGRRRPPGAGLRSGPGQGAEAQQGAPAARRGSRLMEVEDRLDDLEARLEEIQKQLEKLSRQIRDMRSEE